MLRYTRVTVEGEEALFVHFAEREGGYLISPEDLPLVEAHSWHLRGAYVGRKVQTVGGTSIIWLHRVIARCPVGLEVDHRNLNKWDNRRSNLRHATRSQNAHNMPLKSDAVMPYKGVERAMTTNKGKPWRAKIVVAGKRYRTEYFATPEEAAHAYNDLAEKHFGEFARASI